MRLAINGGIPAVKHPLPRFNTIGENEISMVTAAMRSGPLSGYLGGIPTGGLRCEALEAEFAGILGVRHAVCVNSATSGLLAACVAAGVAKRSTIVTTPYTMSATAAAPAFLGANIRFGDIEEKTFSLETCPNAKADVTIITNLFGHPAHLSNARKVCDEMKMVLIEDNAQAPFAMEGKRYAGTVGHIGVFSFNIHKHLQCGEGGIVVTDSDSLSDNLRNFRNHGELAPGRADLGLNLRMTEVTAAIALCQLHRREKIISSRIELAERLTHMVKDYNFIRPPVVREGCKHVYYCWVGLVDGDRDWFVKALQAEGVPIRGGYVTPLNKMPAFDLFPQPTPVTDSVERRIVVFEICAHDPSNTQLKQVQEAFYKVCDEHERRSQAQAAPLAGPRSRDKAAARPAAG